MFVKLNWNQNIVVYYDSREKMLLPVYPVLKMRMSFRLIIVMADDKNESWSQFLGLKIALALVLTNVLSESVLLRIER